MTRDDVERIVNVVLKGLSLELDRNDSWNPNSRTVRLMLDGEELTQVTFDVAQKPEYEG